jgi:glycyl-tRNA synthetase alpha chain
MNFDIVYSKLRNFWLKKKNCMEVFSSSLPKGAGTLDFYFFLGPIVFDKYKIISQCESIRPNDAFGVYNNNRLFFHHQFEVILKPAPKNALFLFKQSLFFITKKNAKLYYIEFLEDNWKHEMLEAYGVGYECRINGLEIAQITYFNVLGGITLQKPVIEFAYGIERITSLIKNSKKNNNLTNVIHLLNFREKDYYDFINKNYNNYVLINKKYIELQNLIDEIHNSIKQNLLYIAFEKILLFSHQFNIIDSLYYVEKFNKQKIILKIKTLIKILIQKILKKINEKKE